VHARRAEAARLRAAAATGRPAWALAQPPAAAALGVVGWHHFGSTWHGARPGRRFGARMAASGREAARLMADPGAFLEVRCRATEAPPPGAGASGGRSGADQHRRLAAPPGGGDGAPAADHAAAHPPLALPSAPAPTPDHEPAPFLCEEFVEDALTNGECVAVVITGGDGGGSGSRAGGEDGGAAGGKDSGGAGAEQGSGGAAAAGADAAAPPLFDGRLAWRLRARGCLMVHIGPGDEAPAALVRGPAGSEALPAAEAEAVKGAASQQESNTAAEGSQPGPQQQPAQPAQRRDLLGDDPAAAPASATPAPAPARAPAPGELIHIQAALGPASARLARPPRLTLAAALREAAAVAGRRLGLAPDLAHGEGARPAAARRARVGVALLQLACSGCEWDALAGLAADAEDAPGRAGPGGGAAAAGTPAALPLSAVDVLIVEAAARPPPDHRAAAAAGLLYQRLGFLGYLHQPLGPAGLRLGWVRQPWRGAARAAVLGS
jgi:hypothetical protein